MSLTISRENPFNDLTPISRVVDDFINQTFPQLNDFFGQNITKRVSYPKIDIIDEESNVLVKAAIPGHKKQDISLSVDNDILTIYVNSTSSESEKQQNYYYREIKMTSCKRSVFLPDFLERDCEKIQADYENGILTITIPKKVKTELTKKSNTISIK